MMKQFFNFSNKTSFINIAMLLFMLCISSLNSPIFALDEYVVIEDFNGSTAFSGSNSTANGNGLQQVKDGTFSSTHNHVTFKISGVTYNSSRLDYAAISSYPGSQTSNFTWDKEDNNYDLTVTGVSIGLRGYQAATSTATANAYFSSNGQNGTTVDCKTTKTGTGGAQTVSISKNTSTGLTSPTVLNMSTTSSKPKFGWTVVNTTFTITTATFTYKVTHKRYQYGFNAVIGRVNNSSYGSATASGYTTVTNDFTPTTASKQVTFTATPTDTKNYKFVGWYSDEACTQQVSSENPYKPTLENSTAGSITTLTLYAKFAVKGTPVVTCNIEDEYEINHSEIDLQALWTREGNGAITYSIVPNSFVASGTNNEGATAPALRNGRYLSFGQAGKLQLKMEIAADGDDYFACTATKDLTIKKKSNTLKVNNSATYHPTMQMGKDLAVTLTATNPDYTNFPIQLVEQTAGDNTVAVLDYTQNIRSGTVHSKYKKDATATWSFHQDENYLYEEANNTFSIDVALATEMSCAYLVENDASVGSGCYGATVHEHTWTANNVAGVVQFEASKYNNLSVDPYVQVEERVNGEWADATNGKINVSTSYVVHQVTLSRTATGVRFKCSGSFNDYVRNVSVSRKTWLNAEDVTIEKTSTNNSIYPSDGVGIGTLTIHYSLAGGGDLHIYNDNPKFTLSQTTISNADCQADGKTTNIDIQYESATAGTDYAHLVIYNDCYRKEVTITGKTIKKTPFIEWNTTMRTIPVGFNLYATHSQPTFTVTYKTSDSNIIKVSEDGHSLEVIGAGKDTIIASAPANEVYNAVSDTAIFTVTNDIIQYIVWEQNLMNLLEGGSNVTLKAEARTDKEGTFPTREITYTSSDETVVKVVVVNDTTKLQIMGQGTTYVTAKQEGGNYAGHVFAPASPVQKKVVVRDPDAGCVNFVFQQESDEEFFQMNTDKIDGIEYSLSGEPEFLSVDLKRKYYKALDENLGGFGSWLGQYVNVLNYSSGDIILQQYINGWSDVHTFKENDIPLIDDGKDPKSFTNIKLDRKATKIRFVRPEGGQGYHYVSNCQVTLARYIETVKEVNFGAKTVGDLEERERQLNYNNITGDLKLEIDQENDAFSVLKDRIEGGCGDKGNKIITIIYNPKDASEADSAKLTISDDSTSCVVTLRGSASKINRTIHWDDLDEYNTINMYDRIVLNASVTYESDASKTAGEVVYEYSTNNKLLGEGNVRFTADGDFTITATAPATDIYNAAPAVTKHFHVLYRNNFTFEGTDGVWDTETNWNVGIEPISTSDVTIDNDVTLETETTINSLTINEGKTLTIADGAVLTIGAGNSLNQTTYGNIIVEAGGQLNLGSGDVQVNDFTLFSNFENEQPKSGQVSNPTKLTTHGDAYFILDLDPSGSASYGWYSFTVPFHVDAMNGVYRLDNGNWVKAVNEVNYAIMDYHEDLRAQGKYGWKKYRSTLQPGVGYLMTVENQLNRYRFTKTKSGNFNTEMTQTLTVTDGDAKDKGWNSLGNGTTSYVTYASTPRYAQLYNHSTNAYDIELTTGNALVVGAAYFVQAETNNSTITMQAASDATTGLLRAPQRDTESDICFVNLSLRNNGKSNDKLFITCDDNAAATYTIGKDVVKMGATSGISVARLWANAKNATLGAVDVAYNGNEAIIPLGIYTPVAGVYTIAIDNNPTEDVYLTRNGIIVWNLSMSDYTFDFNAGTDTSYALQVVRRINNTATGVDELDNDKRGTDFVEKIIVNGQLYILRDGMIYDAQGKKVSNF